MVTPIAPSTVWKRWTWERGRYLDVVDRLLDNIGGSYRVAYAVSPKPTKPATDQASGTPSPEAVAAWQGSWQAYQYGTPSWTVRFDGDRFRGEVGPDDGYEGTIEVRPDANPAEIDLRIEDCRCSYRGDTSKAIYRRDGNAIILSAPRPGSDRPTAFNEDSGELVRLVQLPEP